MKVAKFGGSSLASAEQVEKVVAIIESDPIIAAVLYAIGFFMRKKNQEKLNDLEKRKENLFDLPVIEEVDEVKRMHLVGQSQNTFREWNQQWTDISTKSFAELESQIFKKKIKH